MRIPHLRLHADHHVRRRRGIVAGALLLVVACEQTPVGPFAAAGGRLALGAAAKDLSGEAIYRGIVFGDGPVADLVPVIRAHGRLADRLKDDKKLHEVRKLEDRLVQAIQKTDPAFFAQFARDMRSGNPQVVDLALRRAGEVSLRAGSGLPEVEKVRELKKSDPKKYAELREALANGGAKAKQMVARGKAGRSADAAPMVAADGETTDQVDLALAQLLDEGGPGGEASLSGIFVGLFIVGFLFIWLEAVLAQDYGVVLNIVAAINAWVAVFGTMYVVSGGGGGGGGGCGMDAFYCEEQPYSLYYEQAVASTTEALAVP